MRDAAEVYADCMRQGRPVAMPTFDNKLLAAAKGGLASCDTCSAGEREVAVAPSGNLYPCARMVGEDRDGALVIGHLDGGVETARVQAIPRGPATRPATPARRNGAAARAARAPTSLRRALQRARRRAVLVRAGERAHRRRRGPAADRRAQRDLPRLDVRPRRERRRRRQGLHRAGCGRARQRGQARATPAPRAGQQPRQSPEHAPPSNPRPFVSAVALPRRGARGGFARSAHGTGKPRAAPRGPVGRCGGRGAGQAGAVYAADAPVCGTTRVEELGAHGAVAGQSLRRGDVAQTVREIGLALGWVRHAGEGSTVGADAEDSAPGRVGRGDAHAARGGHRRRAGAGRPYAPRAGRGRRPSGRPVAAQFPGTSARWGAAPRRSVSARRAAVTHPGRRATHRAYAPRPSAGDISSVSLHPADPTRRG